MLLYLLIPAHTTAREQGTTAFGHLFHGKAHSGSRVEHLICVSIGEKVLLFRANEPMGRAGQCFATDLLSVHLPDGP